MIPRPARMYYSRHLPTVSRDDLVLATAMACWFREASYAMVEAHYAEEGRNSESNGTP